MKNEETTVLKEKITDALKGFENWRQEDVERGGISSHLLCTKRELVFLLGLIERREDNERERLSDAEPSHS